MYRDRFVTSYTSSYFYSLPSAFFLDRNTVLIVQQSIVRGTFWLKGNLCWSQIALAGTGAFFLVWGNICSELLLKLTGTKRFCSTDETNMSTLQVAGSGLSLLAREILPFQRAERSTCQNGPVMIAKSGHNYEFAPSMERFANRWQHVKSCSQIQLGAEQKHLFFEKVFL